MSADDQMARDHRRDMLVDRRLRDLEEAIKDVVVCPRVKGTKLATALEEIRGTVGEYRAQITKAWD